MVNAHYPKLKPEAVVYYIFFSNLAFYLSLDSFLFRLFEITFFDHFCTVLIKQKPERIWKIKNHILDMLLKKNDNVIFTPEYFNDMYYHIKPKYFNSFWH